MGARSSARVRISDETFSATGLMVVERNWLDVYPWERWGQGGDALPRFHEGQTFMPQELLLKEVRLHRDGFVAVRESLWYFMLDALPLCRLQGSTTKLRIVMHCQYATRLDFFVQAHC